MRCDVLIARATRRLEAAGSPTPRLDAEVLAMAAMKVDRTWLYTWGDKPMATLARARFEAWVAARNEFIEKLRRDDLAEDIGGLRVRLLRLGEHLTRTMPPPTHFVQEWMEAVNDRIQNWDGWSGDFNGLLFKPSSSKFDKMGQEWARAFANDPDRWTKFCEVMEREGN